MDASANRSGASANRSASDDKNRNEQVEGDLTLLAQQVESQSPAAQSTSDHAGDMQEFLLSETGKTLLKEFISTAAFTKEFMDSLQSLVLKSVRDVVVHQSKEEDNGIDAELCENVLDFASRFGIWTPSNPPRDKLTTRSWISEILVVMKDSKEISTAIREFIPKDDLDEFVQALLKRRESLSRLVRDRCNNARDGRRLVLYDQFRAHVGRVANLQVRLPVVSEAFLSGVEVQLSRKAGSQFVPRDFMSWFCGTFNVDYTNAEACVCFFEKLAQEVAEYDEALANAAAKKRTHVARDRSNPPKRPNLLGQAEVDVENELSFYKD